MNINGKPEQSCDNCGGNEGACNGLASLWEVANRAEDATNIDCWHPPGTLLVMREEEDDESKRNP